MVLGIALSPSKIAAETLLRPGDTIKLSILGLPNSELITAIDADGFLTLSWFGRVDALDRTLTDVLTEVRGLTNGQLFKRYTADGQLKLIQLTSEDISLEVVAFRPVIVSGEIARPGEIAFRPGLTVRGAIAIAGGVRSSLLTDVTVTDPGQLIRWQNDYSRATIDHATVMARLWRVQAQRDETSEPQAVPYDQVAVTSEVFDALLDRQRNLIENDLGNLAGDRAYLVAALSRAQGRVLILLKQQDQLGELVASDEEEEARTRDLVERSLIPAPRLAEVRRTTLLSATRLLDVEEKLANSQLEVARLEREINRFEETRAGDLLSLQEQLTAALLESRLRLDQLAQNLSSATTGQTGTTLTANNGINLRAFRRADGIITEIVLDLNSVIEPGDVIEVSLSQ
ncbi:MAG: polysaccharide export outer membrane protein [Yoonia sp.]|jgi:polysaccharide export outer membrane protein